VPKVRLIDLHKNKITIVTLKEALEQAKKINLDLVEINPNADPPVCRIIDYGKFLYKKNKLLKEQKKKQKVLQIKEIKFRPTTGKEDYQVKLRNLIRFLENGNKVKITLRFRGREITHQQIGINMLNQIKKDLDKISIVELFPNKIENRQMLMLLGPKK